MGRVGSRARSFIKRIRENRRHAWRSGHDEMVDQRRSINGIYYRNLKSRCTLRSKFVHRADAIETPVGNDNDDDVNDAGFSNPE
jgi:hypothetical protein